MVAVQANRRLGDPRGGQPIPGFSTGVGLQRHLEHPALKVAVTAGHLADVVEALGDLVEDTLAVFGPSHLPAAEAHGDADVLAVLEKATSVPDLEVHVVVVGLGPELDFLELVRLLLLLGFLGRFLLFVLVFPPIHESDDGGACARSDLNEIESGFSGLFACFVEGDDPDLLSVGVDEPDRADTDVFVYAGSGLCYEVLLVGVIGAGARPKRSTSVPLDRPAVAVE
jgi:hypothetical protein